MILIATSPLWKILAIENPWWKLSGVGPACQLHPGSDTPVLDGCRSAQRLRNQQGRPVQPAEAPIEEWSEVHRCRHCPSAKKPMLYGVSLDEGCSKIYINVNIFEHLTFWEIPHPLILNTRGFLIQTYLGTLNRGWLIWGGLYYTIFLISRYSEFKETSCYYIATAC